MAAVSDDTDPDVCPIREGDRFREGRSVLTVVEIVASGGTTFCRIESERGGLPPVRYRMPRRDVRARVRRGCWQRIAIEADDVQEDSR